MIRIKIKCGIFQTEKSFPETVKGNADSVKWLTVIYDKLRSDDSFFFKHKELIAATNESVWPYRGHYRQHARWEKVNRLNAVRERIFEVDPPSEKQDLFKLEITHV